MDFFIEEENLSCFFPPASVVMCDEMKMRSDSLSSFQYKM